MPFRGKSVCRVGRSGNLESNVLMKKVSLLQCGLIALATATLVTIYGCVGQKESKDLDKLVGTYVVGEETNQDAHKTAVFSVFKSSANTEHPYGLNFEQKLDPHKGLIECDPGVYNPVLGALACKKVLSEPDATETLTVGLPESDFCKNLGARKNTPRKKIIVVDDCKILDKNGNAVNKCACYEIVGQCSNGGTFPDCNEREKPEGSAPPSPGAGSGGQR